MKRSILVVLWGGLLLVAVAAKAVDWPMLGRDKTRNAVSPEKNPPVEWDVKTGKNIKWQAKIGSLTFGSPVVANGLVWIGTNNEIPRDPGATNPAGVLMCFRERDGKFLYQHVSPRREGEAYGLAFTGICSSPMIEGDRLWFTTTRSEVICLNIKPVRRGQGPAKELWKLDMIDELGVAPRWAAMGGGGLCSIPASHGELIYVITGNGTAMDGKTANPRAPALVCLNKHTGNVVWEDNSPHDKILFGEWGAPIVIEVHGRAQVVAPQGDGWLRAFDARTGALIWKFDINPKNSQWMQTRGFFSTPPVFYQNRIYIAIGNYREFGEGPGRLCCIDPTKTGDISMELESQPRQGNCNPKSGAVWHADDFHRTLSTVAIHNGLVIAADFSGFVNCRDASTGQSYWKHQMPAFIPNGSPLIADGKAYVAHEDGDICIFGLGKEERLIAVNHFDDFIFSSPVFANQTLYAIAGHTLYAIERGLSATGRHAVRARKNLLPDAIYVPTPNDIVEEMLKLARVGEKDTVYDLGSGDGRIVIAAALQHRARAVGFEVDQRLIQRSRDDIQRLGIASLAQITEQDLFTSDLTPADVVMIYLPSPLLERLKPQFSKLRHGARIVSHQFEIPGVPADQVLTIKSSEDAQPHHIFMWTTPLK